MKKLVREIEESESGCTEMECKINLTCYKMKNFP